MGMVALLLIQMFPQMVAVAAIYLLVLNVGTIFHPIGLNTLLAVIIVYLGGAMGVQTWLMKGFFDTIPKELDESARVDGATPAQIFWGVVLPLALPILAVIGLWSFIASLNEYVLASVIMQTPDHYTLPFGLRFLINGNYSTYWGYFAAAALMAAIPAVALFAWLQRFIVSGLAQGAVKG
jgi:arabinogalactan oligomer/maltooligosaccharide transport system permease protein